MSTVRIVLSSARNAVATDHLWQQEGSAAHPALLDSLPTADRYQVVVPPERIRLCCPTIPAGPQRKALAALPFLIEEQLAEPLEHYEIVALPQLPASQGKIWLAALERDWLATSRAALASITQGEIDWVVEGWQWPVRDTWSLRLEGQRTLLSRGGPDRVALPTAWLIPALTAAHGTSRIDTLELAVIASDNAASAAAALSHWCAEHQIALREVSANELADVWGGRFDTVPWRLFEQRRSSLRRTWQTLRQPASWRLAGGLIALALVVELVGALVWWGVLAQRINTDRAASVAVFREMAGPTAVVVDPLLQARRLLQTQRHAAGLPVERDFLPLLAALGEQLPAGIPSPTEIQYDAQRLRLTYAKASTPTLQTFATRLRSTGWIAETTISQDGHQVVLLVSR